MNKLDLLAVQGTLKSLLQYHSSKAPILQCAVFFIVQLSHPYMTIGKTITLIRWIFVGKVMPLLFNMLSKLVIAFLLRSKHLPLNKIKSLKFGENDFWLSLSLSVTYRNIDHSFLKTQSLFVYLILFVLLSLPKKGFIFTLLFWFLFPPTALQFLKILFFFLSFHCY